MPQIDQIASTWASQAFWFIIVFGLIYFGLAKTVLPKVGRAVDARAAKIAGDLDAARSARDAADEARTRREAELAKARADGQAAAAAAKAEGAKAAAVRLAAQQAELDQRMAVEEARVASARTAALAGLDDVAAEAAREIVRKLVGVEVAPEGAMRAVREVHG